MTGTLAGVERETEDSEETREEVACELVTEAGAELRIWVEAASGRAGVTWSAGTGEAEAGVGACAGFRAGAETEASVLVSFSSAVAD